MFFFYLIYGSLAALFFSVAALIFVQWIESNAVMTLEYRAQETDKEILFIKNLFKSKQAGYNNAQIIIDLSNADARICQLEQSVTSLQDKMLELLDRPCNCPLHGTPTLDSDEETFRNQLAEWNSLEVRSGILHRVQPHLDLPTVCTDST